MFKTFQPLNFLSNHSSWIEPTNINWCSFYTIETISRHFIFIITSPNENSQMIKYSNLLYMHHTIQIETIVIITEHSIHVIMNFWESLHLQNSYFMKRFQGTLISYAHTVCVHGHIHNSWVRVGKTRPALGIHLSKILLGGKFAKQIEEKNFVPFALHTQFNSTN